MAGLLMRFADILNQLWIKPSMKRTSASTFMSYSASAVLIKSPSTVKCLPSPPWSNPLNHMPDFTCWLSEHLQPPWGFPKLDTLNSVHHLQCKALSPGAHCRWEGRQQPSFPRCACSSTIPSPLLLHLDCFQPCLRFRFFKKQTNKTKPFSPWIQIWNFRFVNCSLHCIPQETPWPQELFGHLGTDTTLCKLVGFFPEC